MSASGRTRARLLGLGVGLVGAGIAAGAGIGCDASREAGPTSDRGFDDGGAPNDGATVEVATVPPGCATTLVVPGDLTTCRIDWQCSDGRSFIYTCGGGTDGDGGTGCFCVAASTVTAPAVGTSGCGGSEQELRDQAERRCGWTFDGDAAVDGGDQ